MSSNYDPGGDNSGSSNITRSKKSACQKFKDILSLTEEGASPINWRVLLLVVVALFSSCYSITFLFPFLPDMILHFGYKEEEKGYFAGLIASSMFAGRIFGSYFWGWLSDWKGRKPVLLICLVFILLTNIGFGFSVNLAMALVFRFLTGLFNGCVGTCKTVLYEISDNTNQAAGMSAVALAWGGGVITGPLISGVLGAGKCVSYDISDNTNQGVSMSILGTSYGVGLITGPLISGYLASPAVRYPNWFSQTGLFGQFPFLLPSLFAALICVFAIVLVGFLMPETLALKKKKNEMVLDVHEDENLINKTTDQSDGVKLPTRPIVNRQLSKVTGTEVVCNTGSVQSLGEKPNNTKVPQSFSPSIKSLEFADASVKSNKTDPSSQIYGYGCIVTSHGDLLLPDMYSSRRSFTNLVKRQRSAESESNVKVKDSEPKVGLSVSHGDVRKAQSLHDLDLQSLSMPHIVVTKNEHNSSNVIEEKDSCDKETEPSFSCKCLRGIKNTKFVKLMQYRDVRSAIFIYTTLSFGAIGFDDVFTIWASTDRIYSGLGFSTDQIGNAIGLSSLPLVFLQVVLFPKLEARYGAKMVLNVFCLFLILCCTLTPSLRVLQDHSVVFWTLLMIMMGLNKIATTTCFSANGLHINNSVPPQFAGSANGVAMTFTAIGRTIAPVFGGSVFAWSITYGVNIGFPFDVNLVFIFFSFTYLISNILAALLPKSLDKQKLKHTSMMEDLETD